MLNYSVCLLLPCLVMGQAVRQTIVDQEDPDSALLSITNTESCVTIGGDNPNLPCVFPFSLGGGLLTFNACFWKDDLEDFICSTRRIAGGGWG